MATHEFAAGAATIVLPLAGGAAAVGAAVAILLWRRGLFGVLGLVLFIGVALAGGVLLALLAPMFTTGPQAAAPVPQPSPSVLAQRVDALIARAIAANSPLACVDAAAGNQVEEACEAAIFARPETIAAAVSFVTAKVVLLAQAQSERRGDGKSEDAMVALLRHDLSADRFGIVAHVLEATYGCSAERCDAFAAVKDATQIKANLRDSRFDRLVAKHAAAWPAAAQGAADSGDTATGASAAKPKMDFPSASDIPPVSIMVPEEPRHGSSRGSGRARPKPIANPRLPASRPAQVPAEAVPAAPAATAPSSGANSAGAARSQ